MNLPDCSAGCLFGTSRKERKMSEEKIVRKSTTYKYLAFSGIHLINRDLAKEINSVEKSSITNYYLEKAHNKNIRAYIHNLDLWEDIGKFETFKDRLS